MSSDRFIPSFLTASVMMVLGVCVAGLAAPKPKNERVLRIVSAATSATQVNVDEDVSPDYHVWRVFRPSMKDGYILAIVSINAKHFNRKDMSALATKLRKEFALENKLNVALFDDEGTPRHVLEGVEEMPTFYAYQLGLYHVDRPAGLEFIKFSRQKGMPNETIRFKLRRQRKAKT